MNEKCFGLKCHKGLVFPATVSVTNVCLLPDLENWTYLFSRAKYVHSLLTLPSVSVLLRREKRVIKSGGKYILSIAFYIFLAISVIDLKAFYYVLLFRIYALLVCEVNIKWTEATVTADGSTALVPVSRVLYWFFTFCKEGR